jgi:hypothetical protein
VCKPLNANGIQYIQVNAAPYLEGFSSGFLDPPDAIIKFNSTLLDVQIHQKLFTSISKVYLNSTTVLNTLNTSEISTTLDINSMILTPLFPKMIKYHNPRPVIAISTLNATDVIVSNQSSFVTVKVRLDVKI